MQFLRAIFTITVALFLCFASIAKAKDFVMCPALDKIRQAAPLINKAELTSAYPKKTYAAMADKPVFQDNNLYWSMGITAIEADSADEAIRIAQTLIPNITVMASEIAREYNRSYTCVYFLASSHIYQMVFVYGSEKPDVMQMPNYFLRTLY